MEKPGRPPIRPGATKVQVMITLDPEIRDKARERIYNLSKFVEDELRRELMAIEECDRELKRLSRIKREKETALKKELEQATEILGRLGRYGKIDPQILDYWSKRIGIDKNKLLEKIKEVG